MVLITPRAIAPMRDMSVYWTIVYITCKAVPLLLISKCMGTMSSRYQTIIMRRGNMESYNYSSIDVLKRKEKKCPWADVPSLDSRQGNAYKKKTYTSNHTIAPAYNKGAYQVISKQNIKDIGR